MLSGDHYFFLNLHNREVIEREVEEFNKNGVEIE